MTLKSQLQSDMTEAMKAVMGKFAGQNVDGKHVSERVRSRMVEGRGSP
ncbi:MAG: hypothetical protein HY650_05695 [Acidobacteria bacterium]|nr:hypothetical protein [Acidobacteriota bacterium]